MSTPSIWILERVLGPAILYLAIVFLFRPLLLHYFRSRYSSTQGMEEFLGRFRLKHRGLSFDDELDTLAAIQKRYAHAWGMAGLGTMGISLCCQQFSKGQVPWLFLGISLVVPFVHAWAMTSSAFAGQCFRVLGVSSLEAYFQPAGDGQSD